MAGVDGLLRLAAQHDADELRLGSDEAPRMFKRGAPQRLSVPPTTDEMLRMLLEPLLTDELERVLRAQGHAEQPYTCEAGAYVVTFLSRGGPKPAGAKLALDVVFRRQLPKPAPAPAPIPTAIAVPVPTTAIAASAPAPLQGKPVAREAVTHELESLLQRAVDLKASDVHLCTGDEPRLRIDGLLRPLPDLGAIDLDAMLGAVLDEAARAQLVHGRSYDAALALPSGRFRLNVYRSEGRLAAALRVLPPRAPRLAELHLPLPLEDLVAAPHGLVIVCGPTGSGKSATLAALAEEAMRRRPGVLITLEDPIEYALDGSAGTLADPRNWIVRQRQIGVDVRDFPTGLRDALREDPDVLLIGEMRDAETITLALTAAETGHLVLTSLHSRSAAASVQRIVDSYPPERQQQIHAQLADALRAIVSQRLLPRARGGGRLPALEVLRSTTGIANLIREGKTAQMVSALQAGRKEGMIPLERCLADLVRAGQITREAATAQANDTSSLQSYLAT